MAMGIIFLLGLGLVLAVGAPERRVLQACLVMDKKLFPRKKHIPTVQTMDLRLLSASLLVSSEQL